MSKFLSKQLKMVTAVDLSDVPDDFHVLCIDKQKTLQNVDIHIGESFLIELENYIIHPSENFTLHKNFNNNIAPTEKFMRVIVLEIMGKMVKIEGMGFNMKTHENVGEIWVGWLPRKSMKIKKELF